LCFEYFEGSWIKCWSDKSKFLVKVTTDNHEFFEAYRESIEKKREQRVDRRSLAHLLDEFPAGYSWWVALQQSPLPLHQPANIMWQDLDGR